MYCPWKRYSRCSLLKATLALHNTVRATNTAQAHRCMDSRRKLRRMRTANHRPSPFQVLQANIMVVITVTTPIISRHTIATAHKTHHPPVQLLGNIIRQAIMVNQTSPSQVLLPVPMLALTRPHPPIASKPNPTLLRSTPHKLRTTASRTLHTNHKANLQPIINTRRNPRSQILTAPLHKTAILHPLRTPQPIHPNNKAPTTPTHPQHQWPPTQASKV